MNAIPKSAYLPMYNPTRRAEDGAIYANMRPVFVAEQTTEDLEFLRAHYELIDEYIDKYQHHSLEKLQQDLKMILQRPHFSDGPSFYNVLFPKPEKFNAYIEKGIRQAAAKTLQDQEELFRVVERLKEKILAYIPITADQSTLKALGTNPTKETATAAQDAIFEKEAALRALSQEASAAAGKQDRLLGRLSAAAIQEEDLDKLAIVHALRDHIDRLVVQTRAMIERIENMAHFLTALSSNPLVDNNLAKQLITSGLREHDSYLIILGKIIADASEHLRQQNSWVNQRLSELVAAHGQEGVQKTAVSDRTTAYTAD